MRLATAFAVFLVVAPATAADKIPLNAPMVDIDSDCETTSPSRVVLYQDALQGYDWGCSFERVRQTGSNGSFDVDASCSADEDMSEEARISIRLGAVVAAVVFSKVGDGMEFVFSGRNLALLTIFDEICDQQSPKRPRW